MSRKVWLSLSDFALGFAAPLRGARLILANRRIRRWALIPLAVSALVFTIGATFAVSALARILPWAAAWLIGKVGLEVGGFAYETAYWVSLLLAWPIGMIAIFYLLLLLARVLVAPAFPLLAECVLLESGYMRRREFGAKTWLVSTARMTRAALGKLVVFAVAGSVLFFLSFLPGLGLFTGFGFLLLIAFDAVDASFEALEWSFQARFAYFCGRLPVFSGLASAMGLVFLLPGPNVLLLPAAVVGAADLVRRLEPTRPTAGPKSRAEKRPN